MKLLKEKVFFDMLCINKVITERTEAINKNQNFKTYLCTYTLNIKPEAFK